VSPYASRGMPRGSRSWDGVCGRGDGGIVGVGWAETVSGIILGPLTYPQPPSMRSKFAGGFSSSSNGLQGMAADCFLPRLTPQLLQSTQVESDQNKINSFVFPPVIRTSVHPSWWGAVCWCYRPLTSTLHRGSVVAGGPANTNSTLGRLRSSSGVWDMAGMAGETAGQWAEIGFGFGLSQGGRWVERARWNGPPWVD